MTFPDAVRDMADNWIRPIGWRGVCAALAIKENRLVLVPAKRGGVAWHPDVRDILDDWEIVTQDEVLDDLH